jgi:uncharacterized membrane protein YkgB
MSDFYHPMRNLRKPMSFDVTSGFVSMSDMFNDVCILVIFLLTFWISSRKWCCWSSYSHKYSYESVTYEIENAPWQYFDYTEERLANKQTLAQNLIQAASESKAHY